MVCVISRCCKLVRLEKWGLGQKKPCSCGCCTNMQCGLGTSFVASMSLKLWKEKWRVLIRNRIKNAGLKYIALYYVSGSKYYWSHTLGKLVCIVGPDWSLRFEVIVVVTIKNAVCCGVIAFTAALKEPAACIFISS